MIYIDPNGSAPDTNPYYHDMSVAFLEGVGIGELGTPGPNYGGLSNHFLVWLRRSVAAAHDAPRGKAARCEAPIAPRRMADRLQRPLTSPTTYGRGLNRQGENMSFVRFKVTATNTEVAVNPDEVISIAPEANTPANDTQLYIDNMLRVVVDLPIDQVAQRLGPDFVRFEAASPTPFAVYVNRNLVTHVSPNPDVPTACFIGGRGRKQAVRARSMPCSRSSPRRGRARNA